MEINKNSLLYKIAYNSPLIGVGDFTPPSQTNLCRFFWRVILRLLIVWPWIGFFSGLTYGIMYIIGFFFACRPTVEDPLLPYKKWPTVKGHRVYPIYFVLAGMIIYWRQAFWNVLVWLWSGIVLNIIGLVAIGVITLISLITYGIIKFKDTDAAKLLGAYLKAKKEKICPIIRFVDEKK